MSAQLDVIHSVVVYLLQYLSSLSTPAMSIPGFTARRSYASAVLES